MKRSKLSVLAVVTALFLAMLACSWTDEDATPPPPSTASSAENAVSTDEAGGETAPTITPNRNVVPEDVPVMEGAYNMDITSSGTQITYSVPGSMDAVFTYYLEELEGLGWLTPVGQDSSVGSMGSLGRKNANGDTITLSFQYNGTGDFVRIQIAISRVK